MNAAGVFDRSGDVHVERGARIVLAADPRRPRCPHDLLAQRLDRSCVAFLGERAVRKALGMAAQRPVSIDDAGPIDTSFPGFVALMNRLGGQIAAP